MRTTFGRAGLLATAMTVAPAMSGAQPTRGGSPKPIMVVTTAWLAEHARAANLIVIQVSSKAQFDSVHIPGARQVEQFLQVPHQL